MSTVTNPQETIQKIRENFQSPQDALTQTIGGSALMLQDARTALQQVINQAGGSPDLFAVELIEPIARAIGWAEALVFVNTIQDPAARQQLYLNGQQN